MKLVLLPNELRVLGVLLEKQISTPEQYPLSLNALTNGCNQKSNRDPVMDLDEKVVQNTVEDLIRKHLVREVSGFGSRVAKYQHRFANTEFSELKFSAQETAILCELFLRGAQTPGELRSHTTRLCTFKDADDVDACLSHLSVRDDGPFVRKLAKEPGKREARYQHLFGGNAATESIEVPEAVAPARHTVRADDELEKRVSELEQALADVNARLTLLESRKA